MSDPMNRHAGPPAAPGTDAPAEPSPAERASTLVHLGRTGMLATLSRRHPGHPFGSVMPYALDEARRPLFLISSMAMHTQNLEADGRASLLVTGPGAAEDPLASGRVTLIGEAMDYSIYLLTQTLKGDRADRTLAEEQFARGQNRILGKRVANSIGQPPPFQVHRRTASIVELDILFIIIS